MIKITNKDYFTMNALVFIAAPNHTNFPRGKTGTIMKINDDNTYTIMIPPQEIVENVPYEYLRPDNLLCSGKKVAA